MSRYADAHSMANRNGPGDARPTAMQIIKDENREGNMTDKVFLVTGASSGIGIETGRALAATGAKVYLGVRDLAKGKAACESFLEPGRVELIELDLDSLKSVRAGAEEFIKKSPKLNVLVCNAGVMSIPTREVTEDGWERQLAVNYLGHFLLFWLLKDLMIKSSTPDFQSRLINVASTSHHATEILWDDFNVENYHPWVAYGHAKRAQIYMASYVERHFGSQGLHALSLMPGLIMTNLAQYVPQEEKEKFGQNPALVKLGKSIEQGAATTIWAAVGREWEGTGGKYLEDCAVATVDKEAYIPGLASLLELPYDEAKEERLWKLTVEKLGLSE